MLRTEPDVSAGRFLSLTHFLLVFIDFCIAPVTMTLTAVPRLVFPAHFS